MNSPTPPSAPPAAHPWNINFKAGEEKHLHCELIVPLLDGLIEAGAVFCHLRNGRPFRRGGQFHFDLDDRRWSFRLGGYCNLRWVWRITVGTPMHTHGLCRGSELTMALEEINEDLGRGLAAMLRTMASGQTPVWEMFNVWNTFPQYSWSQLCWARYQDWRGWRDARREFLAVKPKTHLPAA